MTVAAIVISIVAVAISGLSVVVARRSLDQARKARLDPQGPGVVLVQAMGDRRRWFKPDYPPRTLPGEVQPGREFVLPANGEVNFLIGAQLVLRNEGTSTAFLELSGFPMFDAPFLPDTGQPEEDGCALGQRHSDGAYELPPGDKCILAMRDGLTLNEWSTIGGEGHIELSVRATDPRGAVSDSWVIKVATHVLDPVPGDAGRWRVLAWVPTEITVRGPTRSYAD